MNLRSLTDSLTGIIPNNDFMCPYCGFGDFGGFHGYKPNYCPNCGKRVNATAEPNKTELDKLEIYLKENNYDCARIKENFTNQIIVFDANGERAWDAICHHGSYGYEDGLLEIMGCIVDEEKVGDSVEGWLTAEDVIQRLRSTKNICSSNTLKGMDKAVENMKNNNVSGKLDLSEFE